MSKTPNQAATAVAPQTVDSPGTWRHPRLQEISRRYRASTFSEKNLQRIVYNTLCLMALWSVQALVKRRNYSHFLSSSLGSTIGWIWFALQLVFVIQIIRECLPLVRTPDDLSDIPLTAAQRQLLGLPPCETPPTPNAVFSTPPRYSRTPSLPGSVGSRASYNSSPLSGRGSPAFQNSIGGSPFSSNSSPLMHKAGNAFSNGRNSSIGASPSPFGSSTSANLFPDVNPVGAKRAGIGLNSKWLYERSRRASANGTLFQSIYD
ncbi:hypothetical protein CDD82_7595 [Ophiocordyceps australis]|uniref:Nuclear pore complex component n=1 Tax=Ophiocordyceps australis TaxID=1399860 RepID=A0A2C5ZR56_9HYPO|nr:hypothetical protein CDD82_7595 [Ophiocordyceps australis]